MPACIIRAGSFLACLYYQSRQLPCLPVLSEQAASLSACIIRAGSFHACLYYQSRQLPCLPVFSEQPACIFRAGSFHACLYYQSRQLPCLPVLSEQAASLPSCIISVCLKRIHYKISLNIRYQKEGQGIHI